MNPLATALGQSPVQRLLVLGEPGPFADELPRVARVQRIEAGPPRIPYRLADQDHSIDAVLVTDLLSQVPDPAPILVEIQRVLRPGGVILAHESRPARNRNRTPRDVRHLLGHYFEFDSQTNLGGGRAMLRAHARDPAAILGHFEALAPDYAAQIPTHLQRHYLEQKLRILERVLPPPLEGRVGLDLGCGLGQYATAVGERMAARVVGIDASRPSLRHARRPHGTTRAPGFVAGDSLRLPFRDESFDFAYAINLVHHLKRGEQERALGEVHRVLRHGAPFVLFEINTRNPLYRWYMRHVFPRTRRIDRGDEEFVHPDRMPLIPQFRLERIHYGTFTPDFLPAWALGGAKRLERWLERSPIAKHGIHYAAVLRKTPATA